MNKQKQRTSKAKAARKQPARKRGSERGSADMRGVVDGVMSAVMMVDRDLVITYMNPATVALLRKHEATFKAAFAGFDVDRLIGTCIDVFHKHPEHQRRLLADPSRLPVTSNIRVGALTLQIAVSAVR